ncbi:MAG: dihydroorotase [Clostridiaceae bacterium]|nr:dihydroorotase [Clostridiaceae bacterium]
MLLIYTAHIMDPYTGLDGLRDILIDDNGIIVKVEKHIDWASAGSDVKMLDAKSMTVAPGFVDTHVHFRDPGQTQKEDIHTGMRSAAAGGYTTVICMANTKPVCDNLDTLQYVQQTAAQEPIINVLQACAITKGLSGQELTDFDELLAAGAPGFTDDGVPLRDAALTMRAMEEAVRTGTLLSFHEEAPEFVPSPGVNFGSAAAGKFGVPGAKPISEEVMVARDIALALRSGARVVFQHISSAHSVALIRAGKALGANIYAEVTPHHLALTEDAVLEHGTLARMNPPLRTEADRQALIAGLKDGTIDMIATDHAPHTAEEKARDFAAAPSGIIGLETAFSVCNTTLVKTGRMTRMQLLQCMSKKPAEIYGLTGKSIEPGNRAELVLLDWDAHKTYTAYQSKSANSPFTGKPLRGAVHSIVMGQRELRFR